MNVCLFQQGQQSDDITLLALRRKLYKDKTMKRRYGKQIVFGISLMLLIYLCLPTFLVLAQDPKTGQSS